MPELLLIDNRALQLRTYQAEKAKKTSHIQLI